MTKLTSILEKYEKEMEQETIRILGSSIYYDQRFLNLEDGELSTLGIVLVLLEDDNNKLSKYLDFTYIDIKDFFTMFMDIVENVAIEIEEIVLEEVFQKANELATKMKQKISIDILITALLSKEDCLGYMFLEAIEDIVGDVDDLLSTFSEEKLLNKDASFGKVFVAKETVEIKKEDYALLKEFGLESFCKILNSSENIGKPCKILKRDKEVEKLWSIISKARKRNTILVGEPGVGKSAILEAITHQIDNETCPKNYIGYKVMSLDVEGMIAGCRYVGDSQIRFKNFLNFLKVNPNIILFIDEAHLILGAGASSNDSMDFANVLKPILTTNEIIVVGATTNYEYEKYFSKDPALKRRFIKLKVKEPKSYEVYDMIKNQVEFLAKAHGLINPSKRFIEKVIFTAACFDFTNNNPDRSIDLMDRLMANAKMKDRKEVSQKDIEDVFYENYKKLKKFSQYEKESTAYHEIGHFIARYFLPELTQRIIAVTMVPADNYLGATIYEESEDSIQTNSYFEAEIICGLAGRISEKLVSNELSAGARVDLKEANRLARKMVTEFGFKSSKKIGANTTLKDIELSENQKNAIQKEVDIIIKNCTKRTEKLIQEHKELIHILSKELMKKGILGPRDLKRLVPKLKEKAKVI